MSAALEQADASAASDPAATSTPVESSAPAASEQATSASPAVPGQTSEPGPIPYARFKEVNESKKSLEDRVNALAWANGLDPHKVQELLEWRQKATSGDPAFIREYLSNAPASMAAAIRSEAARILGQRNQGATTADDAEPAPDLNTEVGPMRSPQNTAQWLAWRERQQEAKFDQRISPLKQQLDAYQQREQAAARDQDRQQFTQAVTNDAKTWPHFETFKAEIAAAYKAAPQPDPRWTEREQALFEQQQLTAAYIRVMGSKGLAPKAQTQSEVMADLTTRANAATESGRTSATTPTKPKSMLDSLERAAAAASR